MEFDVFIIDSLKSIFMSFWFNILGDLLLGLSAIFNITLFDNLFSMIISTYYLSLFLDSFFLLELIRFFNRFSFLLLLIFFLLQFFLLILGKLVILLILKFLF